MEIIDQRRILECATTIVASYVTNNTIQKEHLSALIADAYGSLARVNQPDIEPETFAPAVPVKRSVQPDYIICLEDGKKFKSLKRHLMSHYQMTPAEYREKWRLPSDYPMVAPNYALARSELAKKSGLGRREAPVVVEAPRVAPAKTAKKKGAGKKAVLAKT